MKTHYNLRVIAARAVAQVLDQGQSLGALLPPLQAPLSEKDRALLQELCFGIMRVLPQLEWLLRQLMAKPLTGKQRPVHYLLMVGLYQLTYTRIPPHAALAETVEGAVAMKRPQFKGLINGVLRQFQRQQPALLADAERQDIRHLHPSWLQKRILAAWPAQYAQIIDANNQRPPMWLRVNRLHHSRDAYLALLAGTDIAAVAHSQLPDAIRLEMPCNVGRLPGFDRGWVTVQDASAQGCALLLAPQNSETILDLCAAPGGKTTHILEIAPAARVMAVDVDGQRAARIHDNLQRLGMQAEVVIGDGRTPDAWRSGMLFDRILLDAPCSATGVIRRHPDIKWLRRDGDIAELAELQRQILCAAWRVLKLGGTLLYATCSILPEENRGQIAAFLADHPDALLQETGDAAAPGLQCLPVPTSGDGFFYAKMIKETQAC
ncbi:Ribosomal RNA small subunit methyltransferase B [Sodalis glossinidius str. 'morsitans']|uniref:Ribosomal RNA small subunit methyltransferase B n=2 Tax=Sodalis glossinidius (strain morsitans) TaxID=343509 RepID=RSMB_SODGM|nr:16S rRNA (cytosine(967)-C(5))-methyltransferase RsmB [Sodalis glossinidius]Q2NQQ2.1 RecName: Full=Ribosomal RNA small subunit methyltransferase B; AltName: Full=16S rRNA m5C967 methyltransferase; AltName: Full=rRNA (cytosine-C(5)-)-methyltransferase RsmB [Sodalis glossinidius str. 'morsitans']BAE75523.1 putative rRNA methylase [Sodalis glossinidius str. 'morsitans']CRL46597.1 Ribosomal RNA small subunit methyltransferase B [Sodalis glossinidius str. 'morsitans']